MLFLLIVSVTPASQVSLGTLIPTTLQFANYLDIWSTVALGRGMINSLLICGVAGLLAVIVGTFRGISTGALSLSGPAPLPLLGDRHSAHPGDDAAPAAVCRVRFHSGVPRDRCHRLLFGLMLTYLTFSLPFAIWLMVAYLRTIPRELEEAAMVDGLSQFKALLRVTMPLALPGMIVAFVFAFLLGWNDVLFASVLTNDTTRTLAVDLQVFSFNQDGLSVPQYGQLMAAGVVAAVPVVILYLVLQRYLVGGLTLGGVK